MHWKQAVLTIFLGNVIVLIPIWDPVQLMQRFHSPVLAVIAVVTLTIATLSTNIAANAGYCRPRRSAQFSFPFITTHGSLASLWRSLLPARTPVCA